MRRLTLLLTAVFVVAAVATPAQAKPPMDASGTWDYTVTGGGFVKLAGPNAFFSGTDDGTWAGTLNGTTYEEFVAVFHKKHGTYQGTNYFVGEVDGKEGTLIIKTNGSGPLDGEWSGSWVILSGTGDLSNLRGQGKWWGPLTTLTYDGKVHFSG